MPGTPAPPREAKGLGRDTRSRRACLRGRSHAPPEWARAKCFENTCSTYSTIEASIVVHRFGAKTSRTPQLRSTMSIQAGIELERVRGNVLQRERRRDPEPGRVLLRGCVQLERLQRVVQQRSRPGYQQPLLLLCRRVLRQIRLQLQEVTRLGPSDSRVCGACGDARAHVYKSLFQLQSMAQGTPSSSK